MMFEKKTKTLVEPIKLKSLHPHFPLPPGKPSEDMGADTDNSFPGSYYYSNPNGSTYYNNGQGGSKYNPPSGK